MTASTSISKIDAQVWRTATWAAPFTIQVVLGVAVSISWLVGKYASDVHGFIQFALGASATLVLSAAISAALYKTGSLRAQGIAISIVGSAVVATIGATTYGFWIVGW